MKDKGVKVKLSKADALFLRQHFTRSIRILKQCVKAWEGDDSPSAKIFAHHLKRVGRIREAVSDGIRISSKQGS